MRVAKSTLKAKLRELKPGRIAINLDELAARQNRQELLNQIAGRGCGECSGIIPIFADPDTQKLEFRCPLLEPVCANLSEESRRKAALCQVPQLYRKAEMGEITELQDRDIWAACPFLEVTGV